MGGYIPCYVHIYLIHNFSISIKQSFGSLTNSVGRYLWLESVEFHRSKLCS